MMDYSVYLRMKNDIFNQYNVKCNYVGNPIIENFIDINKKIIILKYFIKNIIFKKRILICLLFPGSRDTEINNILSNLFY